MNDIPFQVALSMNNAAGFLFGNRHLGVSVQRWVDLENFGDAVTLVDYMFEEMAFTGSDTVIVDLTGLEEPGSPALYPLSLVRFCLSGERVRGLAVVGLPAELGRHAGFAELVSYAKSRDITFVQSEDFAGAVALLNGTAQAANRKVLPLESQAESENTYAGSVSCWPTHAAVVLTLTGNDGDFAATEQAVQKTLQYCRDKSAKILVLDTTASAPVIGSAHLAFVLEKALTPLLGAGLSHIVHVRPRGDKLLQAQGAPDVREVLRASGMSYDRIATLAEATIRLDQLAGHLSHAPQSSAVRH